MVKNVFAFRVITPRSNNKENFWVTYFVRKKVGDLRIWTYLWKTHRYFFRNVNMIFFSFAKVDYALKIYHIFFVISVQFICFKCKSQNYIMFSSVCLKYNSKLLLSRDYCHLYSRSETINPNWKNSFLHRLEICCFSSAS